MLQDIIDNLQVYYHDIVTLLPKLLLAIIVSTILYTVMKWVKRKIIKFLRGRADDKLLISFVNSITNIIVGIIVLLVFLSIVGLGNVAGSILGAAGISAFVIGFALKDIGENFLAGIIMAFDRPFRLGDTVMTNGVEGTITQMSLRDTHIKTFDGKDVYVPNGQIIKNPLYNYTIDGFMRGSFSVGVDYGEDIELVRSIILNTIKTIPGVLKEHKLPRTHVKNLNTSTIDIEVHYWIDTFDKKHSSLEIKSLAQASVIKALAQKEVGMPADIVEIKNYDEKVKLEQIAKA